MAAGSETINNHAGFIWSVADLLRGDYKQSEYGRVILPFTVLRRFDCVLEPVKEQMLERYAQIEGKVENFGPILDQLTDTRELWNTSPYDLPKLLNDPDNLATNLKKYIAGFSDQARDILDRFGFAAQINRLEKSGLLYLVTSKFVELDLGSERVGDIEMGYLYEELIRRFSELSNETAGEHFTPRDVIRLMVELLLYEDDDLLSVPGTRRTIFDPACGTGGMLSVAQRVVHDHNQRATLTAFGQELNDETYATCRSDMMVKGQDASNIASGNSFSEDGHAGQQFDYLLSNPPFGVEWKKVRDVVQGEHESLGFGGRFGAGTPRINDGSLLFLQHMISKFKPAEQGGSRLAIVFNGSPLFTGAAGSGESEIRRWIIENDWLEAIVALPDQLFYNTGISTYVWLVTNRKEARRRGKVQLIDARESFEKMRKSLGDKRKYISDDQVGDIVGLHGDFEEGDRSKIFDNVDFGFLRITVERPSRLRWEIADEGIQALPADKTIAKLDEPVRQDLAARFAKATGTTYRDHDEMATEAGAVMDQVGVKGKKIRDAIMNAFAVQDPEAPAVTDSKGNVQPDPDLRHNENVPLSVEAVGKVAYKADVDERLESAPYQALIKQYMAEEVLPYVEDAWVDHSKTKIGYEIPLTRHFYVYTPPRPLAEIDAEIKRLEAEIQELLAEVTE